MVFNVDDYDQYKPGKRVPENGKGFKYSGSYAARNIEKIYTKAEAAGVPAHLEPAVHACFGGDVKHALVCSGFYVLHQLGGNLGDEPGIAAGSCETDGPLGAFALVRAFVSPGLQRHAL